MKTNRTTRWIALLALVCVLVLAFAVPVASAASYSKVYGKTLDRVRVRASASTSATVTDNIVKGACVYVTSSKTSGSSTFIEIKYINSDGSTSTGWLCQSDGKTKYVEILSAAQAKSAFGVADGKLPSKKVGTFTASQRKAGTSSSSSSSGSSTSSDVVKDAQTKLKALGYYSADITGNIGAKTETAIKAFQKKQGLTADGKLGSKTIEALNKAYANKSGSSSSSSSSSTTASLKLNSTGTAVSLLQQNLAKLGYYYAEVTGHYGAKTEAAVKKFQKAKGLTADGVAGTKTLEAIASAVAGKGGSSSSSSSSASGYGRITGSKVYLRKSASTSSDTITTLSKGTVFTIISKTTSSGNTWYRISVRVGNVTREGYVFGDYVEKISSSDYFDYDDDSSHDSYLGIIIITHDKVNMREGPGLSYPRPKLANKGDTFTCVDRDGDWYKLSNGLWVHKDYVSFTNSSGAIGTTAFHGPYSKGDSAEEIRIVQIALKALGFYDGSITGSMGTQTAQAVQDFRKENGLGNVPTLDKKTYEAILKAYLNDSKGSSAKAQPEDGKVYNLDWQKYKDDLLATGIKRGAGNNRNIILTDIETKASMYIYVQAAGNHLDVEPLTAEDTKTMYHDMYGVSAVTGIKDSNERRPMVLTILSSDGKTPKYQFVCAMYGYPHGSQKITTNLYPGQFCLHFLHSTTSGTKVENKYAQEAIERGIEILKQRGITVKNWQ